MSGRGGDGERVRQRAGERASERAFLLITNYCCYSYLRYVFNCTYTHQVLANLGCAHVDGRQVCFVMGIFDSQGCCGRQPERRRRPRAPRPPTAWSKCHNTQTVFVSFHSTPRCKLKTPFASFGRRWHQLHADVFSIVLRDFVRQKRVFLVGFFAFTLASRS